MLPGPRTPFAGRSAPDLVAPELAPAPGTGAPAPLPVQGSGEAPAAESWTFLVKPYLFASGLDGTVGSGSNVGDIEADFEDLLSDLNFGAMVSFEVVPPESRWRILTDLMYIQLEDSGTAPGPLMADVDATIDQFIAELTAAYEVLEDGRLDVLGGLRYWSLEVDLEAGPISRDVTEDWVDPLVGVRSSLPLGERLRVLLRGDVGGFGVGSDFAYELGAGLGWELSDTVQLAFGYRHLAVDYEDDVTYDVVQSGLLAGVILRF